jgi:origin recognition complex subunit 2
MSDSSSSEGEHSEGEQTALQPAAAADPEKGFVQARDGEAYLYQMARASKTSSIKFSDRLERPFTRESFAKTLKEAAVPQQAEFQASLLEKYTKRFRLWQIELQEGFSLLFHGLGSKKDLLNRFAKDCLCQHGAVVIVRAYSSTLGIADMLVALEKQLGLGSKATTGTLAADRNESRAQAICAALTDAEHPVYLLVHSLDAAPLRSAKSKGVLALLAAHPRLHFLASIDHVNAMALFGSSLTSAAPCSEDEEYVEGSRGFAFLRHHTPTFRPFTDEVLASDTIPSLFPPTVFPSLVVAKNDISSPSAIAACMRVVSGQVGRGQNVFKKLAELQLAKYDDLEGVAVKQAEADIANHTPLVATTLASFSNACAALMVSNLVDLRQHLSEAASHGWVLESGEAPKGQESDEVDAQWIWIKLTKEALTTVLERLP